MFHARRASLGKGLLAALALSALVLAGLSPASGAPPAPQLGPVESARGSAAVYIVQMAEDPVVAYDGGEAGYAPTARGRGQHVDPNSAHVRRYAQLLDRRHAEALAATGAPADAKFYDYRFSYNGFAATLTPAQVARLEQQPNVVAVSLDETRQPTTDNTTVEMGLSTPGGFWQTGSKGEDVIIGVIDTGIWPEHPSFSDQTDLADRPGSSGKRTIAPWYKTIPSDWHGTCQSGEQWSRNDCNNKLIGARYFIEGLTRRGVDPADYASARDRDGHGTHTASTAGGNEGVDPSIFGSDLGVGTISGMAPRARIAAYKGCFGEAGCVTSDLVMAIDTAVADGVDVINYSIGSNTPAMLSPDSVSFLFARQAGVFVATSAGNAGPGEFTVGSPAASPWLTAVGASTHSRIFTNTVTLGSGETVEGGSVTLGAGPAPLVDGGDDCPGGLDPAEVGGAIVFCLRVTGIPRVSHGAGVAAAGGVGMILFDPPQVNVTPTDNHVLPVSTVLAPAAETIIEYMEAEGDDATATISAGSRDTREDPTAEMAVFSSRGPNGAVADIIKPDVTAPGVQILAGAAPNPWLGAPGQLFQAIQGTSMSSPHAAGVAALLVGEHGDDWTPAMYQSAMTTTAHQDVDKEDGTTPGDPFDFGGGHIQPNSANDPGLVYDADFSDYVAFLCGAGELSGCGGNAIDPSDLNLPTIGIGELAGSQSVTREVTNVDDAAATYTPTIVAPVGVTVAVDPPAIVIDPGETATYALTFTVTPAATLDEWAFGSITWSDGAGHSVRSPIAVTPVALSAPDEVSGEGAQGELSYDVTFGYAGPFSAIPQGLVPATVESRSVVDDPADDINVALQTGVGIDVLTIPVGADVQHLRVSLFDENTDGEDDLDLYLFDPDFNFIDDSGTVTSAEQVDAPNPVEGEWTLVVHGWETDGADALYDLFTWQVPATDLLNMTVTSPAVAVLGATETLTVAWSGLEHGASLPGSRRVQQRVRPRGIPSLHPRLSADLERPKCVHDVPLFAAVVAVRNRSAG